MSVKFEKEQVRVTEGVVGRDQTTAHKIGEALTGGQQRKGYLAVRAVLRYLYPTTPDIRRRHTSSNSNPTPSEPRCSHPAPSPLYKKLSLHGSPTIVASTVTTSALASPRWLRTALLSALQWATSSLASSNESSLAAPVYVQRSYRSSLPTLSYVSLSPYRLDTPLGRTANID